uniref:ATP-dependent Clp protease ATP-binding subunit clpX n=1 Tax=Rhizophora mucronata TaxID=61149 RepID=A0A2P2MNS5_RHIMU
MHKRVGKIHDERNLFCYFVDFINVNNALLCSSHIVISNLRWEQIK